MNQLELLRWGKNKLKDHNIEEADVKAKKLIEFVLEQTRSQFILNELSKVVNEKQLLYEEKIKEIMEGKPLQYITNTQEFMGLNFYVNENVLIPQPDTELLVEETIKTIENTNQQEERILDLCTGSGAIAVSLADWYRNRSNLKIVSLEILATDISDEVLKVAEKNAKENAVKDIITFIKSNMFEQVEGNFDIIVSNPPYIETKIIETLSKEVQNEPSLALDGGKDGLKFYKIILEKASSYLNSNGYLLFEIGYDQGDKIINLYKTLKESNKGNLEIVTEKPIKDLNGNDRVMIFRKM